MLANLETMIITFAHMFSISSASVKEIIALNSGPFFSQHYLKQKASTLFKFKSKKRLHTALSKKCEEKSVSKVI